MEVETKYLSKVDKLIDNCDFELPYLLENKFVSDNEDYTKVKEWAEDRGLGGELDGFIEELKAQDLLLNETVKNSTIETGIMPVGCDNEEETVKLEEDMMKWCLKNGYLYSLFVELTYGCNLKCVHCYNPKHISSVQIDVNKMKETIDQTRELGVFHITFSGGECTLHNKYLLKTLKSATKKIIVHFVLIVLAWECWKMGI